MVRLACQRMKKLSRIFVALFLISQIANAASLADPAPPKFVELDEKAAPVPQPFERLTFHAAPKPISKNAKTADWPRLLGPNDNVTSPETHLLHDWPPAGPAKVWEVRKGDGYTSPAISGAMLVLFHSLDGKETIECLQTETGRRFWKQDYAIEYKDRYGFSNGPRGSPIISEGRVVTIGVTSILTCLDLKTGRIAWQRDLKNEFNVPQDFFGHGGSALILDGKVIVNVGGKAEKIDESISMQERVRMLAAPGLCVGAFDIRTGKLVWGVKDEWGASYASPIAAKLHGKPVVLVFAGGESKPASGGLLCINPADGTVHDRFPWRADDYISATAQSPTVIAEKNRVFISTCYPKGKPLGSIMLEFDENLKAKEVWRSNKISIHFMNPLYMSGHLYAIDGETEQKAQLVCFDADNGSEKWRKDVNWNDDELTRLNGGRAAQMGIMRAGLLGVDGKVLCLGESGALIWFDLSPTDLKLEARAQLFYAPHTWCLPALSNGLLYIMQNSEEQVRGKTGQRILCYDLRAP